MPLQSARFFPFPMSLGTNQKNNARHFFVSSGCGGGRSNGGGGNVTQNKLESVAPHRSVSQRNALYHGCVGYMFLQGSRTAKICHSNVTAGLNTWLDSRFFRRTVREGRGRPVEGTTW